MAAQHGARPGQGGTGRQPGADRPLLGHRPGDRRTAGGARAGGRRSSIGLRPISRRSSPANRVFLRGTSGGCGAFLPGLDRWRSDRNSLTSYWEKLQQLSQRCWQNRRERRPDLPRAVAEIPWGHNIALIEKLKDPTERLWYARQRPTRAGAGRCWSTRSRRDLYRAPGAAVTNFDRTLPAPRFGPGPAGAQGSLHASTS